MRASPAEAVKLKKLATPGWITRPVPVPILMPVMLEPPVVDVTLMARGLAVNRLAPVTAGA
jgi:hypothetical protein